MNSRTRTLLLILVTAALLVLITGLLVKFPYLIPTGVPFSPAMQPGNPQPYPTTTLPNEPAGTTLPALTLTTTPVIQGPPAFTLLVTPVEARAMPGGTVIYTMTIEPEGGFHDQISLHLTASAFIVYRETFDLGTVDPPYPKVFEYHYTVPSDVPSGITLKGVLVAEGGGYQDAVDLILHIR
jgi:hypothetical protein